MRYVKKLLKFIWSNIYTTIGACFVCIALFSYPHANAKQWDAVSEVLAKASHKTGVPVEVLAGFAATEASFNPNAVAKTSTATGLFGFTKRTWRVMLSRYGHKYGLKPNTPRTNAYANALMGAEYIKENQRYLSKRLGRKVTYSDLYMASFISPLETIRIERASRHLSAADVLPTAAASNPTVFYNKSGQPVTVGEFITSVRAKFTKRMYRYQQHAKRAYAVYVAKHEATEANFSQWAKTSQGKSCKYYQPQSVETIPLSPPYDPIQQCIELLAIEQRLYLS